MRAGALGLQWLFESPGGSDLRPSSANKSSAKVQKLAAAKRPSRRPPVHQELRSWPRGERRSGPSTSRGLRQHLQVHRQGDGREPTAPAGIRLGGRYLKARAGDGALPTGRACVIFQRVGDAHKLDSRMVVAIPSPLRRLRPARFVVCGSSPSRSSLVPCSATT